MKYSRDLLEWNDLAWAIAPKTGYWEIPEAAPIQFFIGQERKSMIRKSLLDLYVLIWMEYRGTDRGRVFTNRSVYALERATDRLVPVQSPLNEYT